MLAVTAMILKEFLVDGFAASEALFGAVPEADLVLAQLPAQTYIAIAITGHEVQQADVEILDHRPSLVDLVQGFLEGRNAGIAAGSGCQNFTRIHPCTPGRPHVFPSAVHILLGFLGFSLVKQCLAKMTLHLRQPALRLGQREITHTFLVYAARIRFQKTVQ